MARDGAAAIPKKGKKRKGIYFTRALPFLPQHAFPKGVAYPAPIMIHLISQFGKSFFSKGSVVLLYKALVNCFLAVPHKLLNCPVCNGALIKHAKYTRVWDMPSCSHFDRACTWGEEEYREYIKWWKLATKILKTSHPELEIPQRPWIDTGKGKQTCIFTANNELCTSAQRWDPTRFFRSWRIYSSPGLRFAQVVRRSHAELLKENERHLPQ